jgi:nucleotide-binding universal stress UspA family protein
VALCYAAAIADHFGARLTVLSVEDALTAGLTAGEGHMPADDAEGALQRFCSEALAHTPANGRTVQMRMAIGRPAGEILRAARNLQADLIVMSSRGRGGVQKLLFGSTTELVLRGTRTPVLITPGNRAPESSLSEIARHVNEVLAPVDLTDASPHQVSIAAAIARALSVPLTVAHVLPPLHIPLDVSWPEPDPREAEEQAETVLRGITAAIDPHVKTQTVIVSGEPAAEIDSLANTRHTNLIVMGLHSYGLLGPRMGSVTYRVLCGTRALVLALPPATTGRRDTAKVAAGEARP